MPKEWPNWPEGVEKPGTQVARYRREGRLDEAKARRLKLRSSLVADGYSRVEANRKSWEQLPEHYPPLPPTDLAKGARTKQSPGKRNQIAVELEALVARCAADEPDPRRDAIWAYNHHPIPDLMPHQAPSPAAWHLYEQTRNSSKSVADTIIGGLRALVSELKQQNKGEGKHRDDGRQVLEVIEKLEDEFNDQG